MGLPLFKRANTALGAQIWHVDEEFNPEAAPRKKEAATSEADENDPDSAED